MLLPLTCDVLSAAAHLPKELQVVYEDFEPLDMDVPYIAGFLAFREVPAYARLLHRAAATPYAPQVRHESGSRARTTHRGT